MVPRNFEQSIVKEMSIGKRMISDIYTKILIVSFSIASYFFNFFQGFEFLGDIHYQVIVN